MRQVLRLAGKSMFKDYPYQELYFLEQAKRVRDAVQCNMIYIGGASTSDNFATLMREGFDFIQLGRSLLADWNLPLTAAQDINYRSRCTHCNQCVATIEDPHGIHCTQFSS